jgi:hypothetical protein
MRLIPDIVRALVDKQKAVPDKLREAVARQRKVAEAASAEGQKIRSEKA